MQCLCPGPVGTNLVKFEEGVMGYVKYLTHLDVKKCVEASLRDLSFCHINFN